MGDKECARGARVRALESATLDGPGDDHIDYADYVLERDKWP